MENTTRTPVSTATTCCLENWTQGTLLVSPGPRAVRHDHRTGYLPFRRLHNLLQPILPKKLTQGHPSGILFTGASPTLRASSSHSDFRHRNSGVLRPGEMVLVLGAPGSGCTTFLKVVANERGAYANAMGDVRYAGISHSEMLKYYNGKVVYNQEGKRDGIF